jgi:AraC family transcriptional regulator
LIGQAYENDRDSRWHSLCDEKTELSVCYIHIDPSLLSKVALQTMDKSPQFIELPHKFGFTDPLMLQLGLHIRDELKNDNLYGKIYVETAVNMLAVHLLKNYASEKFNFPTIKNARNRLIISRVIEYIQSNLDRDLSLSELASIANRSAFHFAHLFKNVTGAAPHAYITQQRIARAKRLLQNTSLSISTIAMDVGYSPSHFSQVFIRHVGINPRTYRLKS